MSSRDKILAAVAANKPPLKPLPELPSGPFPAEELVKKQKFITVLQGIGGKVIECSGYDAPREFLQQLREKGLPVASLCPSVGTGNFIVSPSQTAPELEAIDTAFIMGTMGIAENGSVWLFESQFVNRLLPFICQHLIIVLPASKLVTDMHEAYTLIDVQREGYGVFLAGPSKTADIEQSLVIGAHGARSTTVYLMNE